MEPAMNLVLVGYRCSGKSEVGKLLAARLHRELLDTDALIESHAGCSIESIVAGQGWERFRDIERTVVAEVSRRDNLVIATGGGVILDERNVGNLRANGFLVWLKADAEVLRQRMYGDETSGRTRPSLTGTDPLKEIKEVLRVRTPLYERAAHLTVATDRVAVEGVVERIIRGLPGQ
jgi:shikimate kinase